MNEYIENRLITPERMMDGGTYKYVRFSTGEFRFCGIHNQHIDLVDTCDTPVTAGMIGVEGDIFAIIDKGSRSIGIGYDPNDKALISRLIGRRTKPDIY